MAMQVEGLIADSSKWRAVVKGRAASNHRVLAELERLLTDEGSGGAISGRIERAWSDRRFDVFYDRPLLLIAALRFEALRSGPAHSLFAALGAAEPDPAGVTRAALLRALESPSVWDSLASRFVQTNETSRAVAWLWPAALAGCDRGRPLALVEIGSSAGLNLVADRLPAPWTDQDGVSLEVARAPNTVARVGIDLRPLDVRDDDAVTWMRACIWAGEQERLARFDAAVAAFRADPPELVSADAVGAREVIEPIASGVPAGGFTLAFQTIVRDYLDPATNQAYEGAMRGWLATMPRASALWIELEIDHREPGTERPAVLLAHAPDGNGGVADLPLAHTNYHPKDLAVDRDAARELGALLAAPSR